MALGYGTLKRFNSTGMIIPKGLNPDIHIPEFVVIENCALGYGTLKWFNSTGIIIPKGLNL